DQDSSPDRIAAIRRLLTHYLHCADAAARHLYPELQRLPLPAGIDLPATAVFDDLASATAWLDAERANLVAAARQAAAHGPRPMAWLLADAPRGYFDANGHTVDWLAIAEAGRAAAVEDHDLSGQAAAQINLGLAKRRMSRLDEAAGHYTVASTLAEQAGWL